MNDDDMHPFDRATALEPSADPSRRRAHTSDRYWTFISPFGGASAATLLRAVLEHPARLGDPLAMTVNFCAPVEKGDYEIGVQCQRANKSSQHWSVVATQGASDEAVLSASVVTAVRRESWSHQIARKPDLPPPGDVAAVDSRRALSWVQQYELRFAAGGFEIRDEMPDPPLDARSVLWMRDAEPRPLDALSLVALSDAFFGRIFRVLSRIPPFGTITMTTYFHADAGELASVGTEPLAGVADARVFHRHYGDQTVELYAPGGQLLATSVQAAYFKV